MIKYNELYYFLRGIDYVRTFKMEYNQKKERKNR